ncbi:hypothetical protein [Shimazuella alba]|uniref:Tetratricopeptide repeat protein n=1 Tax=Shimazuella alba TaxID=2690964 RepID=A0A6I4W6C7_9BACL|nr:hypothetical protein [Shimazuella alba]MXQ55872.1 hypothetical protein [Shimazuella alba]
MSNTFEQLLNKLSRRNIHFSDVPNADAQITIAKGFAQMGNDEKAKSHFAKAVKAYEKVHGTGKVQKALDKISDKSNTKNDNLQDLIRDVSN